MHSLTTSYNIPSYAFHVTYGIRPYLLMYTKTVHHVIIVMPCCICTFVRRLWSDIQHPPNRTAISAHAVLCDFQMMSTDSVVVFKSVIILV